LIPVWKRLFEIAGKNEIPACDFERLSSAVLQQFRYNARFPKKLYQVIPQETESDICKVAYT